MIRVCYLCKRVYGEKEPLDDRRISHGLCDPCVPIEAARIEEELRAIEKSAGTRRAPLQEATR
jgi:hypothetical protein